jgi:hypothetical protein
MTQNNSDFIDYLGGLETKTSPSTKKEIDGTYAAVLEKAGLKRKVSGTKKFGRVLLIAAAVAAGAVVTAAASGLSVSNLISAYFGSQTATSTPVRTGLTKEQLKTLRACGTQISQSVTCGGTTILLKSAIADQSHAYLWFELVAPKGVVLPRDDYDFSDDTINFHNENEHHSSGANWDVLFQKDDNPKDNRKKFLIDLGTGGIDLQGRRLTLKLTDLSTPGKKKLSFVPVVKGTWNFDFTLSGSSPRKELNVNRKECFHIPDALGGGTFTCTLKKIVLSTFSASLVITDGSNLSVRPAVKEDLTVHYKDGTQKSFRVNGGCGNLGNTSLDAAFDTPLDLNTVSSVTIGDVTVPVS